jgi:putative ABC transport system ATP-binding protein
MKQENLFVSIKDVTKSYGEGEGQTLALQHASAEIQLGTICVIMGPSGSGKSTLLNAIGGLESIDAGEITVAGENITDLDSAGLSQYRRERLGFIFQFYNLIPNLTVRENIQTCEFLSDNPTDLETLIETLELKDHAKKFPWQLSGGQQQRCAIARALIKNPLLLLCDEPTGALDFKNSREILLLLERLNKSNKTTILIVTHNEAIRGMAHRTLFLKDGEIVDNVQNDTPTPAEEIMW